jgi:inner membrane transporter RhtA
MFALGAALCWALYILFGKRAARGTGMAAVSIGLIVACCITVPLGIQSAGWHLLEPHALLIGAGVAILSSALPYVLEMKAMGHLSTRIFGVVTSAAPAIAALTGFAVLGELSPAQWLAVALMISATAGSSLGRAA